MNYSTYNTLIIITPKRFFSFGVVKALYALSIVQFVLSTIHFFIYHAVFQKIEIQRPQVALYANNKTTHGRPHTMPVKYPTGFV